MWMQEPVTSFWVSLKPWEVCLVLGWTMAEGVMMSPSVLVEGLIFIRACVCRLGMRIGRCQTPKPTRCVGWPPLIVFQILIPSKGPLICYSKLTHINMHLTSKHGKCPTLIHSIKTLPFIQQNIPRAASTFEAATSTMN